MTPEEIQLMKIFHPFAYERIEKVRTEGLRFVHYTHAESALLILKNKEVWMRKLTCMNDFMEAEHGWDCLSNSYNGEVGKKFKGILNDLHRDFSEEIEYFINGWRTSFKRNTYITCFSEHLSSEDSLGRLSMWRAYGKPAGVALVIHNTPFFSPSDALKVYFNPMAYLSVDLAT